jgi:hypothetical protein
MNRLKPKIISDEDKLYQVPEDIRALEGKQKDRREGASDDLAVSALPGSIGIAEVALPAHFRDANMRATEAARKDLE